MKLYRVLLILLVILMSCSQQSSKDKDEEKPETTKPGKKRKQKGIKQNKLDEKSVEEETKDNDTGKEEDLGDVGGEARYSVLEKKVKELREKHERAKNKLKEAGYSFPREEELRHLFPNIREPERTEKIFLEKQYSFANIAKLISQTTRKFPGRMDDFYAGLEYDAGLLTELDKIIPKLNYEGKVNKLYWFYLLFLNKIGEAGEFNRKVLYEYLNDATLAKLKGGNDADIEKANRLLDEFMKKKADLVELFKAQIKAVENNKKRSYFLSEFIEPRRKETGDAYYALKESSENIEEFCSKLNK
ncbi:hypothetical protein DB313_04940 (plasmid) [Borrelia turcica IST7]|uniref:Mlp family lipoprotein n=1 Tax=Borrelia turcica IST7 TaxID=1104446 RepID=A0A386PPU4_9SPIR|nr:hypothetical protein [Borrelia turcica]AYE36847.1 hypothetical protein DB313_04940 [Borrelia turcica IST7]